MKNMLRKKSCSETDLNDQELCDDELERSSMPSSDTSAGHSSMHGSTLLSIPLRRCFDERLKNSRNNFNKSRIRVEALKLNSKKMGEKLDEKPPDPWITSGAMESRDAVLVFRTDILNATIENGENSNSKECLIKGENQGSSKSLNVIHTGNVDCKKSTNVLLSLPCDQINKQNNGPAFGFSFDSLSKENIGRNDQKFIQFDLKNRDRIKSPKKRFHDSLSSSDNSISSESDDLNEIEATMLAAADSHISSRKATYLRNNITTTVSSPQVTTSKRSGKHGDDNKENIKCISNMPAAKLHITYKFMNTETKLLKRIFLRHGLTEVEGEQNFNILWTGVHMKPDILRNLSPYQRVNHFPRSFELTRKDRLYKNIEKMQHLRGFKHFDIVPQSFMLPLEYRDLVTAHNKCRGPWIVKPAASSRGRGIFIVNAPDQIPCEEQVLVSKYIAEPLCIDGHKCDVRVYVLVTSFDPLIVYIYEEGLVRLATVKYDRNAENLWNPCMHLCNYSINKYHSDYIKSSDADDEDVGHKWTLSALLRHLKIQGCDTKQLMLNIEDLIIKSIFSCAQSIISACRMFVPSGNNCFELYGFDILIDDTLKPWLLEINLSPSLGIDSPLDAKVKASLMTDLLTLIGIPAYTPEMRANYDTKWSRFKNISYSRRANSADPFGSSTSRKLSSWATAPLTLEETKIVRNLKLQNGRRGGFVRIFPTEDSMQRYGSFLDTVTGIPISTAPNQAAYSIIIPHNFNQMIFNQIFGSQCKDASMQDNTFELRMQQYERVLELAAPICFHSKQSQPKCIEEGKKLRIKIRKLIEAGNELTPHQARHAFGMYLELVLKRLTEEPKPLHEKIILKFINRVGGTFKAPSFTRKTLDYHIVSKDRSAMVAKLLSDYLESYNHDTEAYVDSFDNCGMIPITLFNEFLSHAQESDLESILALHTNLTHTMPFLYNRCSFLVPTTPPIPTGTHGFLKALPSMVPCHVRDNTKIDSYYKTATEKSPTDFEKSLVEKTDNKNGASTSKSSSPKHSKTSKQSTTTTKAKKKAISKR